MPDINLPNLPSLPPMARMDDEAREFISFLSYVRDLARGVEDWFEDWLFDLTTPTEADMAFLVGVVAGLSEPLEIAA